MRLRGQLGISKRFDTNDAFYPAEHTMFEDYEIIDANKKGQYDYSDGEAFSLDGNITLSWAKTVADKHNFYVGADASFSNRNSRNYIFSAVGFPNESLDFIGSSLGYPSGLKPISDEYQLLIR